MIQPFWDSSNHFNNVPSVGSVWCWATYFPALSNVIGQHNPNSWNGGVRETNYIPATGAGNPLPYGPGSGKPAMNCTVNYAKGKQ